MQCRHGHKRRRRGGRQQVKVRGSRQRQGCGGRENRRNPGRLAWLGGWQHARGCARRPPPLARHLLLDLVDLADRHGTVVGRRDAAVEHRSARRKLGDALLAAQGVALAQLAQLVKLAAAHKVVAPFALQHVLEHLLAVLALALGFRGLKLAPVHLRVAHKPHHPGQQSTGRRGVVLAHAGFSTGAGGGVQAFAAIGWAVRLWRLWASSVSRQTSSA